MSSAEDHRLAAQRRAEALVARIKSDKSSRETTPTRTKPVLASSSSFGGSGGGLGAIAPSASGGDGPATAMSSEAQQAVRSHIAVTPERTPQTRTPGRAGAAVGPPPPRRPSPSPARQQTELLLRSATPPRPSPPQWAANSSPLRARGTNNRSPSPVSGRSRATPSRSPVRARSASPARIAGGEEASASASAIERANAAIESARRVATAAAADRPPPPSPSPSVPALDVVRVPSPILAPTIPQQPASSPLRPGTAEFVRYAPPDVPPSPALSPSHSFGSHPGGSGPAGMANLDLRHNDNAYHVVANIVTDRLLPKVPPGTESYVLDSSDRAFFDQTLPVAMRWSFVDALRYRRRDLPDEDPGPNGEPTVAALTRKCCWLGLDRPEEENVLLQPEVATTHVGLRSYSRAYQPPPIRQSRSVESGVSPSASFQQMSMDEADSLSRRERSIQEQQMRLQEQQQNFEKQSLEMKEELYRQQLEIQKGQIHSQQDEINRLLLCSSKDQPQPKEVDGGVDLDTSAQQPETEPSSLHAAPTRTSEDLGTAASIASKGSLDANFASKGSMESRARQQVMTELKEATALMTSSVTPEAANFWKAHVVDLQGRLRALNGELPAPPPAGDEPTDDYHLVDFSAGSIERAPEYVDMRKRSKEKIITHHGGPRESQAEYLERNRKTRDEGVINARAEAIVTNASVVQPKEPLRRQPARNEPRKGYDGHPMVDVVAPADLPAGYTFEAQIGSKRFLATVPTGGVLRGDRFSCQMKGLDRIEIQVPTGHWRDKLFDCFKFGFVHPLVLNTVLVPLIALGQIMTRNQLTWLGERGSRFQAKSVSMNMLIVILFWALMNCMAVFHIAVNLNRGNLPTFVDYTALFFINIVMMIFTVYVVAATRGSIRAKYGILEESCGGKEDILAAMFCMPCTITQMGRHTADFETYRAVCCSDTGLPRNVELVRATSAGTRNCPTLDDSHIV